MVLAACHSIPVERFTLIIRVPAMAQKPLQVVAASGQTHTIIGDCTADHLGKVEVVLPIGSPKLLGLFDGHKCLCTFFAGPNDHIWITPKENSRGISASGNDETEALSAFWAATSQPVSMKGADSVLPLTYLKTQQARYALLTAWLAAHQQDALGKSLQPFIAKQALALPSAIAFAATGPERITDSVVVASPLAMKVVANVPMDRLNVRKYYTWRPYLRLYAPLTLDTAMHNQHPTYEVFSAQNRLLFQTGDEKQLLAFLNGILP